MKKLIVILILMISSLTLSQENVDTVKFIEILEKEFNFQVNEYRRSLGLDSLPTNEHLKTMCESNNERLSRIPKFFTKLWYNPRYREIAHEGFDYRVDSLCQIPRPFLRQGISEIVHSRKITLTNNIAEIKSLAKNIQIVFASSKDHNEALLEKYGFGIYSSFKVVSIENKDYMVVTSFIANYVK